MLAREITDEDEAGGVLIDYVGVDLARAPKRKTNLRLTPAEKIALRDKVWALLANQGLTTYEIAEACARASQSERNIRRRLTLLAQTQAETG